MSTDLFIFGLSILTLVAVIVLLVTREGESKSGDDNDKSA